MKRFFAALTLAVSLATPALAADPIRIGVLTVDAGPFVDDLPRNAMGKVQKNVLRDRFAQ